jgi:hypothetical protein
VFRARERGFKQFKCPVRNVLRNDMPIQNITHLLIFRFYRFYVVQIVILSGFVLRWVKSFFFPKISDSLLHTAFKFLHRNFTHHVQLTLCNDPKGSHFILQISLCSYVYKAEGNFPLPDPIRFVPKLMQLN